MNVDGFTTIDFPPINRNVSDFVYILCWVSPWGDAPFYVGKTTRIWGRLDDYYWAEISAPTDFRVGETVRYFADKGYRVIVKYKSCSESEKEESRIINELKPTYKLLNQLPAFPYKNADELKERARIREFVDQLIGL